MKKLTLLFLIFIVFTNCTSLVNKINGQKRPKKETIETLETFVATHNLNINIENCIFLKDYETLELLKTYHKYYDFSKKAKQPYILLFNHKQQLIDDHTLGGCVMHRPKTEKNFYDELLEKNDVIYDKDALEPLVNSFLNVRGEMAQNIFHKDKPTLIVVWSKFRGSSINKAFFNETHRTLTNKNDDLNVLYLNIDKVFVN